MTVSNYAGTKDLNESQPEDVIKGLTEMAEEKFHGYPGLEEDQASLRQT